MAMPSQLPRDDADLRRSILAKKLSRWAAQPLCDVNRRAVIWTALSMLLIVMISRGSPEQAAFVRGVCMVGMGGHGVLHILLRGFLQGLAAKGLPEAGLALRRYLAPDRISSLDLVIAWAALGAAVSLIQALTVATP